MAKMTYIPRRLSVTNEQGEEVEYSETGFFSLDAPLIVLGEPGAGKSELVRQFAQNSGSRVYNASSLVALQSIETATPPAKTIIDGVDEITAYDSGPSISKILAKLSHHQTPCFVLTCRAVDWQDAANTRIIEDLCQKMPIVGRVLPFNHQEIVGFVESNGDGQNSEKFIQEAQQRDVLDLLKNPQNLNMLLRVVQNNDWPETRLELYQNASLALIREDNKVHESLNRTRPARDKLIEAAGFIFAQLLLSGTTSVRVDGNGNDVLPKAVDLAGGGIDEAIVRCALSTKVFRVAEENTLEPCHRTIAEFLAAKWITAALSAQLSSRRLESLLYGKSNIVPSALRGLHAWIVTLTSPSALADRFIANDPYGFFRYGDPTALTVSQSKHLLACLEKVAEIDPYFRSEDWHATFGRGLARAELRDDIIRIIRNPKTPYQLSHLIIESIQGDDFADDIADDLLALALNVSATPLERDAAIDALAECKRQPNWVETVEQLRRSGDMESLRVAINIVQNRAEEFSGAVIAKILIGIAEAKAAEDGPNYAGLGYGIHKKMSVDQLEESLQILSENALAEATGQRCREHGEWPFVFAQERLERGSPPSALVMWSWLKHSEKYSYHRSDRSEWDKYSEEYFSRHSEYRQSIQTEAIKAASDADALWMTLWDIGDANPGLELRESDLILHMDMLLEEREKYTNWAERWRNFVQWGKKRSGFTGAALEHASTQALQHSVLQEHLAELERSPAREHEEKFRKRERQRKQQQRKKTRERHENFQKVRDQIGTGQHLGALHRIANAYLGRYSDIKGETPIDRVAHLTGEELVSLALEGISAAVARDDIPSARQMLELRVNENKQYFFEPILLAHCAILVSSNRSLEELPLSVAASALAACQWGIHCVGDNIAPDIQKQLELIVFNNKASKEAFIRDTMEPYLNAKADHIPGLYCLAKSEKFSDVAGSLATEWLKKYSQLSSAFLRDLLITDIRYAPRGEVIALIRNRIKNEQWSNEEQRGIWIGAAFLLDYEHHLDLLTAYADEKREHLWPLRAMVFPERGKYEYWPKIKELQHYFLITKFGPLWPPVDYPSSGWSGDQNPWDASKFIQRRIGDLAENLSDQAKGLLKSLISTAGLEGYQDHIKHVYTQQTRRKAEKNKELPTWSKVRDILLKGEPANHDDLQALLMDELEELQNRIRNSQTDEIAPFWNGDTPHDENYCRNRIASALEPHLERYNVRVHIEGAMPDNNRCDLLNTCRTMDVPIEIKGQWHSEIWSAASKQLQNYTREYHAEGRGIYLVLWFGYLGANHRRNPCGWHGQAAPKSFDEMRNLLSQKYQGISERTKIVVLDLSR